MTEVDLHHAPDEVALAESASRRVVSILREAVRLRGCARWVLAGGSTPLALYRLLAARPAAVDWSRVEFYWSDERLVPPTSAASNYGAAREALLDPLGIDAGHCHRVDGEASGEHAAASYSVAVDEALARGDWDLVLLGLGADGHTASLFPPRAEHEAQGGWTAVARAPAPPVERVTLTLAALSRARRVLFLVSGASKAAAVSRVLAGDPALHASAVTALDAPVTWCLDREAAGDAGGPARPSAVESIRSS